MANLYEVRQNVKIRMEYSKRVEENPQLAQFIFT